MKKIVIKSLALVLAILTVCSLFACKKTKPKQSGIVEGKLSPNDIEGSITFSYEATTESKKAAANAYIDAFNQVYKNVTVKRDYDYNTSQSATRISSGQIGDVFYFAESSAYNFAITQSALMPLDYYMQALDVNIDDVYSGIYSAGQIGEHYYYVARDFNQIIFAYNKDYVESKGLSSSVKPDWTWNEFLEICEKLTDDEHYGASLPLSFGPDFVTYIEAYADGHNTWFNTAEKKVDLTSGDTLKAIKELISAAQKGHIKIGAGDSSAFEDKESIFVSTVYPTVESLAREYENNATDWDLINLPLTQNPAFGCGSSGVGVFNRTSNPDAAAAFALFFYTQEGQRAFNGQDGGSVPLLSSLKDEDFWKHPDDEWSDKNWDANTYRSEDYAVIGRFECILPPSVAEVFTTNLPSYLGKVMNNEMSVDDAFTQLETEANEVWERLAK